MSLPAGGAARPAQARAALAYSFERLEAENGGATLVALALAGLVLMTGVVAVDLGALAGARAAAQTAADMAALAALTPGGAGASGREPKHGQPPETGSVDAEPRSRATSRTTGRTLGSGASRAAEIAAANGAVLVRCDCSAVQAVVHVTRRVRLVPGGLTVVVNARARAVLGLPAVAGRATVPPFDLLRAGDEDQATRPRDVIEGQAGGRPAGQRQRRDGGGAVGASVVAVRVAVRDVPPVSLAVLRMGQGSLLLAGALLLVAPGLLRVRWERLRLFALLGLVLFALFPLTFNIGLQYTEASRGALMLATMPIWSAVLGRIAGERLTGRQIAGVGVSVVGIGLAFVEPGRAIGGDAMGLVGDGLLLLTGLLGALYGLIAKRVLAVDNPATVTTYAMLFGTVLLLPVAVAEGIVPAVARLDWQLLGFVAVVTGVLLVNWPGARRPEMKGSNPSGQS